MWEAQNFGTPVHHQPWPSYDEKEMAVSEVEIAIQINGKVRGRIMIPADLTRGQAEETLPQNPDVKALVGDKAILKIIFVPGRLLNIVVQ
jgi:leucyl-tRNA synthetase